MPKKGRRETKTKVQANRAILDESSYTEPLSKENMNIENDIPKTPNSKINIENADLTTSGKRSEKKLFKIGSEDTEIIPRCIFGRSDAVGQKTAPLNPKVKKVYKIIQKSTGALGGNGYDGAIYGELTMQSMQKVRIIFCFLITYSLEKVINYMVENCGLSLDSRFIDVGSGLGKPNFHAAQDPGCRISLGIELEEIRWQVSTPSNYSSCIS